MAAHGSSHESRPVKTACVLKHSSSEQLQRYEVSELVNSPEDVLLECVCVDCLLCDSAVRDKLLDVSCDWVLAPPLGAAGLG
jgi:hypothetical protein